MLQESGPSRTVLDIPAIDISMNFPGFEIENINNNNNNNVQVSPYIKSF